MSVTAHPIGDRWKMSLATELLRRVNEAKKQKAEDEMGVPSYDNIHTPNNHVGNTSNATKERPVSGLGDRKLKKPTANIGTPHKEKGRDMEGVKSVKVSENVFQDLGLTVENGLISFRDQHGQVHNIEADQDAVSFIKGALRQTRGDTEQMLGLLLDYMESGPGQDPRAMTGPEHPDAQYDVGLAAGEGDWPLAEEGAFGNNPVAQALSLNPVEGGKMYMASPDGKAAMLVPMSPPVQKAMHAYMTNPDARADTHAAAARLFQLIGQKVPGVEATQPTEVAASKTQSGIRGKGVSPDAGSGLSMEPMDTGEPQPGAAVNPYQRGQRLRAGAYESAHGAADGEMAHVTVSKPSPAKSASVRGKQNDEPANKGNPGTGKEEKGVKKPQFSVTPKSTTGGKRGENENKSMKKMHEAKRELEDLLGRKLDLKVNKTA